MIILVNIGFSHEGEKNNFVGMIILADMGEFV